MSSSSKQRQKGFVAIIVASMIMVILALITIGFTRIMQREQRQVIDRQLSRQALYAAESGINDVNAAINTSATGFTAKEKTDCDVGDLSAGLDSGGDIAYTCALYDTTPTELNYDINTAKSEIINLESESGDFSTITISWGNATDGSPNNLSNSITQPCNGEFPATLDSDNVTVLKLDLTNMNSLDRADLINNTDYLYLVPCDSSTGITTYPYNPAERGTVVQVKCTNGLPQRCSLTIDVASASSDRFLARVRPIYSLATVTITGQDDGGPSVPVEFVDAQTSIDVTARANDVVRRLRATVPFASTASVDIPEAVFQAFDGVCKLLSVDTTNGTVVDGGCP